VVEFPSICPPGDVQPRLGVCDRNGSEGNGMQRVISRRMVRLERTLRTASSTKWIQIILVTLLGLCAAWMEWESFGNWDFSELIWFVAILILSILIVMSYHIQKTLSPAMWVALGTLCWIIWRFINWIFTSRAGWIIGFISILTYPIRKIIGIDVAELVILVITILLVMLGIWGTYWVYKHFDIRWLRKNSICWGLLLVVVVIVATCNGQLQYKDNCIGVNAFSESMSCSLRDNLGVIGSIWVTLTFLSWALTLALLQAKSNVVQAILWVVALEPVWIAIFFNPTRILGVVLLQVIRASGDNILIQILEANMRILNLLPIGVFFLLIPIGSLLLKSMKTRIWWTILVSAITFAIMLGVLFQSLHTFRSVFLYSITDHAMFVFMALQVWMPIAIVAFVGYKLEVSSMIDNL
jgi:hypothetical protein